MLRKIMFILFIVLLSSTIVIAQNRTIYRSVAGQQQRLRDRIVVWSPDGLCIAVGDGTKVYILSSKSYGTMQELQFRTTNVHSIAYSPDGKHLAASDEAGNIYLWDTSTWERVEAPWRMPLALYASATPPIAFSPDGRFLASGGMGNEVKVWGTDTWRNPRTLKHSEELSMGSLVRSIAFSPDGKYLASGGLDGIVRVWSTADWESVKVLEEHEHWVSSVCFSPDSKYLASGDHEGIIYVWDTDSWDDIESLSGHDLRSLCVAFSPDGNFLVSAGDGMSQRTGSYTGELLVWRTDEWKMVKELKGFTGSVLSAAFSPDGKYLASRDPVYISIRSTDTWQLLENIPTTSSRLSR